MESVSAVELELTVESVFPIESILLVETEPEFPVTVIQFAPAVRLPSDPDMVIPSAPVVIEPYAPDMDTPSAPTCIEPPLFVRLTPDPDT